MRKLKAGKDSIAIFFFVPLSQLSLINQSQHLHAKSMNRKAHDGVIVPLRRQRGGGRAAEYTREREGEMGKRKEKKRERKGKVLRFP